jgi:hypothetical protein
MEQPIDQGLAAVSQIVTNLQASLALHLPNLSTALTNPAILAPMLAKQRCNARINGRTIMVVHIKQVSTHHAHQFTSCMYTSHHARTHHIMVVHIMVIHIMHVHIT